MSLVVDVRDLLGEPGASRRVVIREGVPALATELARILEGRPVACEFLIESVVDGLMVSGAIRGTMELACARCLESFESEVRVEVHERFVEGAAPGADEYPVADGFADLEAMVRDSIMLAMPFAPLCKPGCLGLCDRCGGDRNLGECRCEQEADPRWSALQRLNVSD